jgi:uncharacterized protein (UPF0276 family)
VGLGWRPELAAAILDKLDYIDVVELLAEDYLDAGRRTRRGLRALARQVPMHIHGTSLGLAGSEEVARSRLERFARLIHDVEPEAWSEHLAFVRAGGIELGHMAVPPRTHASVEAAVRNLANAGRVVGSLPHMENVATLIDAPASTLSEPAWIAEIVSRSGCGLLLDVENLHANAVNFAFDPLEFMAQIPVESVSTIHIAGGRWVTPPDGRRRYWLDDHLHPVADPVYALLSEVASRTARPLTVILERDGEYPPMPVLMEELARARHALAEGRGRRRGKLAISACPGESLPSTRSGVGSGSPTEDMRHHRNVQRFDGTMNQRMDPI